MTACMFIRMRLLAKQNRFKYAKKVTKPEIKVAVNVSSSGKPVLRYMYHVNEPGLTLLMKKNPIALPHSKLHEM